MNNNHKFQQEDVVLFNKIHEDKLQYNSVSREYSVDVKYRPMMILNPLPFRNYFVLEFTTKTPEDPEDYYKDENGAIFTFGTQIGLKEPSYLRIFPANQAHENNAKRKLFKVPELFSSNIIKEYNRLLMERGIIKRNSTASKAKDDFVR